VDWVEMRWPSGLTERFEDVAVDQVQSLKEGTGKAGKLESTGKSIDKAK